MTARFQAWSLTDWFCRDHLLVEISEPDVVPGSHTNDVSRARLQVLDTDYVCVWKKREFPDLTFLYSNLFYKRFIFGKFNSDVELSPQGRTYQLEFGLSEFE